MNYKSSKEITWMISISSTYQGTRWWIGFKGRLISDAELNAIIYNNIDNEFHVIITTLNFCNFYPNSKFLSFLYYTTLYMYTFKDQWLQYIFLNSSNVYIKNKIIQLCEVVPCMNDQGKKFIDCPQSTDLLLYAMGSIWFSSLNITCTIFL